MKNHHEHDGMRVLGGSCLGILMVGVFLSASLLEARSAAVMRLDVERVGYQDLLAAVAIQGLANREGPRVFLDTGARDWVMKLWNQEGRPEADISRTRRGVDAVWTDYYADHHHLKFETLSSLDELAMRAGGCLKGVILYDDKNGGNLVVAATLAGLRDAVPVTRQVLAACPALKRLPILEDLVGRFTNSLAVQQWAAETLLPSCSREGVFSFTGGIDVVALDLAIARRMFVYRLSHLQPDSEISKKDREAFEKGPGGLNPPEAPLVRKILAHLAPLSPVWGWGGPREEIYLETLSRAGAFVMCAQVPNGSFHARIPPPAKPLRQRHLQPMDITVEPKHYIAFMVNEGDTFKCAGSMMLNGSWLAPERGQLPINWGINPYLCEQFPGMMAYFYGSMTTNDYFFDGPAGYGYIKPEALPETLLMKFAERTRDGNRVADTRISECWYGYGLRPEAKRAQWLTTMGLEGLTQWRGPQRITFPPGSPPVIDSQHYYDKVTAEQLAGDLIAEAATAPRPWFTVVYSGDPRRFMEIYKRLPPDRFKIVRLDELFLAAGKSRALVEGRQVRPARDAE